MCIFFMIIFALPVYTYIDNRIISCYSFNTNKKHYEVTVTKKLFEKLKNKFINFCKWVWSECKDWHTLVLFAIVVVLMYAPVWLGYILYFVFKSKWAMGVASAYLLFWAGPFTPYFPLCIAITLSLKKLIEKIKGRGDNDSADKENNSDA